MGNNLLSFGFQGSPKPIIPSSLNYGLFSQTAQSTPINGTISELSLIGSGVGTLSIPANQFKVGDSFKVIMTGHINSINNQTFRIRIKTNAIILVDTDLIPIAQTSNQHWKLEVDFTVRAIGVSGVAQIVSGGSFQYIKNASSTFEGVGFSTETFTGFDTTISNTLSITGQWGGTSGSNDIYSEICTLNKTY